MWRIKSKNLSRFWKNDVTGKKWDVLKEKTGAGFLDFQPKTAFGVLSKKLEQNLGIFVAGKKNCVVLKEKLEASAVSRGQNPSCFSDSVLYTRVRWVTCGMSYVTCHM